MSWRTDPDGRQVVDGVRLAETSVELSDTVKAQAEAETKLRDDVNAQLVAAGSDRRCFFHVRDRVSGRFVVLIQDKGKPDPTGAWWDPSIAVDWASL